MPTLEFNPVVTEEVEVHDQRTNQGCRATRKIMCAWADRLTLRDILMSWPRKLFPHNSMGAVIVSAAYEGFGEKTSAVHADGYTIVAYTKALFTVEYETPGLGGITTDPSSPNDKTKTYSEGIDFAVDMLTLPYDQFAWQSGVIGEPISKEEAPSIPFTTSVYRFSRYFQQKTTVEALQLQKLINCTNSSTWTCPILPYSFPTETMLMGAPKLEAQVDTAGGVEYSIHYEFQINPWGWNRFRRPSKASASDPGQMWWELVNMDTGAVFKPFPPKNLNVLRP